MKQQCNPKLACKFYLVSCVFLLDSNIFTKLNIVNMQRNITCSTEAPAWRNCRPDSAESMPPVAKMGKPGSALAMTDTARRAMGRIALPEHIQIKANRQQINKIIFHSQN